MTVRTASVYSSASPVLDRELYRLEPKRQSLLNHALELAVRLGDDETELKCLDELSKATFLGGDHDAAKLLFERLATRSLEMGIHSSWDGLP